MQFTVLRLDHVSQSFLSIATRNGATTTNIFDIHGLAKISINFSEKNVYTTNISFYKMKTVFKALLCCIKIIIW